MAGRIFRAAQPDLGGRPAGFGGSASRFWGVGRPVLGGRLAGSAGRPAAHHLRLNHHLPTTGSYNCKMGTVQQAQRVAGGFAAPADFAALHADRVEAVCRMQAAEGRELTRVWEIGHELEEVRLAAVPDPDPNPNPGLDPDSDPHPHPALGPNLAQTRSALRSALEGKAAFGAVDRSAKPLGTLKSCKGWYQRWRD